MQFLSMQEFLNQYEKTDPFSLQQDIINAYRKERKPQSLKRLPSEKDWRRYNKICPKYYWWETKKVFDEDDELIDGGERAGELYVVISHSSSQFGIPVKEKN